MKFKVGDTVLITGGKDKGKTGEITRLYVVENKVLVKGLNLYKRHMKKQEGFEGGVFDRERPLPTAKVAILCSTCGKPTRVTYNLPKQGDKERICGKCKSPLAVKDQGEKSKAKVKKEKKK